MAEQEKLPLEQPKLAVKPVSFWKARMFGLLVAFGVVVVDVLTKFIVMSKTEQLPKMVIENFFELTFVWNRGISFSFLSGIENSWNLFGVVIPANTYMPALLSLMAIIAISIFVWWLGREPRAVGQAGVGLIIGGAAGNLADRLLHGAVADFLHFFWQNWHFPAFNVADIAITCGVMLLIIDAFRHNDKNV